MYVIFMENFSVTLQFCLFQHESGADLALLLIQIFKNASTPVNKSTLGRWL